MPRRTPSLLLLSLAFVVTGCQKDVHEVRRDELDIAAPGSDARAASAAEPTAPSGEPQGIDAQPRTSPGR
jgi:hypothetical protein